MDLGCLDLGCIEKQITQASAGSSDVNPNNSLPSTSKSNSKNKAFKEANQPSPRALNRLTPQIRKPPRRKTSPLSWFPRQKVDSFLKRKIKLLQEVGGMNSTLDETLGDTNPHFSKVLREKMAVREAAHKAMEARKAALVEASWCRILRAARIESKEAEALLVKAESAAAEAFESAKEIGVIMYDIPDCPRKHYKIETSAVNGGESATHTVATSFDTAFEVDKQVSVAVKAAFVKLSSCPSIGKDEFKELLRKISQNPDLDETYPDVCESEAEPDFETGTHNEDFIANKNGETESAKEKQRGSLVDTMLQRLRCLHEEELSSLATIVATCGLNAALSEAENHGSGPFGEGRSRKTHQVHEEVPSLDKFLVKRLSRLEREVQEAKNARTNKDSGSNKTHEGKFITNPNEENTGLGSVLVKHYSKLEKEIEEAKKRDREKVFEKDPKTSKVAEVVPDFESMLTKHTSKLEKDIEETKRRCGDRYEAKDKRPERLKQEMKQVPSLDEVLVKRVSRLEREVREAKREKENADMNKETEGTEKLVSCEKLISEATEALSLVDQNSCEKSEDFVDKIVVKPVDRRGREKKDDIESLDRVLVKHVSRLEKEKMASSGTKGEDVLTVKRRDKKFELEPSEGSLDQILVKHKSRLEKEKMTSSVTKEEDVLMVKRRDKKSELEPSEGSLDQILVKHKSRLEREKVAAAQDPESQIKHPSVAKREARERELQEAWGGMSFGNSIRPRLSRLQRDKAAWLKAEEEERRSMTEEAKVV